MDMFNVYERTGACGQKANRADGKRFRPGRLVARWSRPDLIVSFRIHAFLPASTTQTGLAAAKRLKSGGPYDQATT